MRRALLAAACAFAALAPATSASAAPLKVGLQIFTVDASVSPEAIDAQVGVAKRVRARYVRIQVPWSSIEPKSPGVYDAAGLAAADRAMAAVKAGGMKAILVMTSTPCWASSAPASARAGCTAEDPNGFTVTRYPPARTADYVRIARFMVKRYSATLGAFEIWNEPDLQNELYWAGPNKVKRYVALVRALYKPLKQASPKTKVLAGAFVGYSGGWLRSMYRAGIKGYYDAMSMHFYAQTLYGLRLNRAVMARYHDTKPVWVTESGWSSCSPVGQRTPAGHVCVSQQSQANFIGDLITSLRRKPRYVAALIDYAAIDTDDPDTKFGLVDDQGALKPAFAAFTTATGGAPKRPRAIRVRLSAAGGRVTATGTGPAADAYTIEATVNGRLRYRKAFYLGPDGTYTVQMPAVLGTVMAVKVTFPWLGTSARASIGTS